jgi:hypothetical protein
MVSSISQIMAVPDLCPRFVFKFSNNGFRLVYLLGDRTEIICFMAEKTFLLIETMVSTSDKIFCMTNTTVPVV